MTSLANACSGDACMGREEAREVAARAAVLFSCSRCDLSLRSSYMWTRKCTAHADGGSRKRGGARMGKLATHEQGKEMWETTKNNDLRACPRTP